MTQRGDDLTGTEPEWAEVAARLLAAVGGLRRATRRAARQAWQAELLPQAQSELLRLAAARPGLGVNEAAEELYLAPNTVSTLVGKLAAQGLLIRGRSGSDGRCLHLRVTPAGRSYLDQWRDLRSELAGRALAGLSRSDQETLAAAPAAMLRLAEQMAGGRA